MRHDYALAAMLLAAFWALCALVHPATRRALLNGVRCMGRYPDLWRIPALFGLGYALFQFAAAALLHFRTGEFIAWLARIEWTPAPDPLVLIGESLLPSAERAASVFTIFTATFPLSAFFALLFLFNFKGVLIQLARALCRRLGRASGILLTAALVLTALAALVMPAVYLLLPEVAERVPMSAVMAVNFLSSLFELLLGIFFLTYLMLMAYAWMRGLQFHRYKLYQVAIRRTGFVLKWSLLIAALILVLVEAPPFIGMFVEPGADIYEACRWFSKWIGHSAVVVFALLCCPTQAILVFHNESLRQALRESAATLREKWTILLPFLGAAFAPFLLLGTAVDYACARLGPDTAAALGCRAISAWLEALLAGWLIAGWVCLYKGLSAGRKEIPF